MDWLLIYNEILTLKHPDPRLISWAPGLSKIRPTADQQLIIRYKKYNLRITSNQINTRKCRFESVSTVCLFWFWFWTECMYFPPSVALLPTIEPDVLGQQLLNKFTFYNIVIQQHSKLLIIECDSHLWNI